MKIFISSLLLVVTSLCQEPDVEFLLDESPELFISNPHSIRSGDDIYSHVAYASDFLQVVNNEQRHWRQSSALADWNYKTNITDHNMKQKMEVSGQFDEWRRGKVRSAKKFNLRALPEDLRRQLSKFTLSAESDDSSISERQDFLVSTMEGIYGSTHACLSNGSCLALEPDLINIIAKSRDPNVLKDAWVSWRNSVGPLIKPHFTEFVDLLNQAAVENGFQDYSEYWKKSLFFETPELDSMIHRLWQDIKPLYLQLHAYVRRKLREYYGSDVVGYDGTIPAHLLGNMWAQHWTNIMEIVSPYPEQDQQSKVEARLKAKVDVQGIFRLADGFYTSMGLSPMTRTFWEKSMFKRPKDREVVCHASAFDMFYPGDFRIKMCSQVTFDTFRTVHHEMGHIEYFMAYADQPSIFREGANAAFHEAVGDTIQLSVLSSSHLKGLGLLEDDEEIVDDKPTRAGRLRRRKLTKHSTEYRSTINNLLSMALEKLAFIPFGLLVDKWRWAVLRGDITPYEFNKKWWEMRLKYQGVTSPVERSEDYFDPGAKYHVCSNSAYISYFISYIQQFQMYQALCEVSGHVGELHQCDFYGSKDAGKKLKHMLSLGSSIPWQEQLSYLTGNSQVTADAILEYFHPLHDWLETDNRLHQEKVGWRGATVNWGRS
ncbi:angiotensin-converting enzyme-like [Physella acuta]|uniref:angiotensin-converting enzyme-like n=1 Tax=Physella acuta TaxID=109671 RepID=UPI0027DB0F0E|nr:angiotensin-converting enzyme-like [Physella acuta]XP_059177491.1 angiotensin-converting enzyme-like [Physella acuta]XP_059177492.1 angiotensin-converting enzyme-like [Physella acuta]XP_059177493.1 angiotensin-converting enzyme-like [Physella acuta]